MKCAGFNEAQFKEMYGEERVPEYMVSELSMNPPERGTSQYKIYFLRKQVKD